MTEIVKKIKLTLLQNYYKELSQITFNLSNHLEFLYENFLLDYSIKQIFMTKLNKINKNINTNYNNFIVENLELNNELDEWILDFSKDINPTNDFQLIEMFTFSKFIKLETQPLFKIRYELMQMVSLLGYKNLDGLLQFFIGKNYKSILDKFIVKYINELNNIFIPISFNIFTVDKTELLYWRLPKTFEESDLINQTRELWIKYQNKYIKIAGIFSNDKVGVIAKTAQINYPNLYLLKNAIDISLEKSSIDKKFIKKFTKYDYLGNMYVFSTNEYLKHIEKYYQKYLELTSSSFLSIMKDFITDNTCMKNMYDIIFCLLLGNEENIDVAGLLLNLVKDKKSTSLIVYNLLTNKLSFNLEIKLKKSNMNMKFELERLKTLTLEDIDYKKQLVANKNIPDNIKSLTLEKIQEMKLYNNEYYKQLTYVKHILNFPWSSLNDDIFYRNLKNDRVKAIDYLNSIEDKLKKSSYGHEEAKNALLQIIGK